MFGNPNLLGNTRNWQSWRARSVALINAFLRWMKVRRLRRHLTPGQRAMIAEKIANLPNGVRTYQALRNLGPDPVTQAEASKQLGTTPKAISRPENIIRRHLTPGQRAMIAAEIANLPHGGDRKSESFKLTKLSLNQEQAAKQLARQRKRSRKARQVNLRRPQAGRGTRTHVSVIPEFIALRGPLAYGRQRQAVGN